MYLKRADALVKQHVLIINIVECNKKKKKIWEYVSGGLEYCNVR